MDSHDFLGAGRTSSKSGLVGSPLPMSVNIRARAWIKCNGRRITHCQTSRNYSPLAPRVLSAPFHDFFRTIVLNFICQFSTSVPVCGRSQRLWSATSPPMGVVHASLAGHSRAKLMCRGVAPNTRLASCIACAGAVRSSRARKV